MKAMTFRCPVFASLRPRPAWRISDRIRSFSAADARLYIGCVEISEGVGRRPQGHSDRGCSCQPHVAGHHHLPDRQRQYFATRRPRSCRPTRDDLGQGVVPQNRCGRHDDSVLGRFHDGSNPTGSRRRRHHSREPGGAEFVPGVGARSAISIFRSPASAPGFSHISATGITLSDQMYMSPRITPPVYNAISCS